MTGDSARVAPEAGRSAPVQQAGFADGHPVRLLRLPRRRVRLDRAQPPPHRR